MGWEENSTVPRRLDYFATLGYFPFSNQTLFDNPTVNYDFPQIYHFSLSTRRKTLLALSAVYADLEFPCHDGIMPLFQEGSDNDYGVNFLLFSLLDILFPSPSGDRLLGFFFSLKLTFFFVEYFH